MAQENIRAPMTSCRCLSASGEPYAWDGNQFDAVAFRRKDDSVNRVETIRCRDCGRFYDVEEDDTPATHAIYNWTTATEPPLNSSPDEVIRWLRIVPLPNSQETCTCRAAADQRADPIFTAGLSTKIAAKRHRLQPPGGPLPETCWVIRCTVCQRWWDVCVPERPVGVTTDPPCEWTLLFR